MTKRLQVIQVDDGRWDPKQKSHKFYRQVYHALSRFHAVDTQMGSIEFQSSHQGSVIHLILPLELH